MVTKKDKLIFNNEKVKEKFLNILREDEMIDLESDNINETEGLLEEIPDINYLDILREFENYGIMTKFPGGFYVETNNGKIVIADGEIQSSEGVFHETYRTDYSYYQELINNKPILALIEC